MPSAEIFPHDRENKGPVTIITSSVLTALGLLFAVARLVSRRISVRKYTLDDYVVVFSTMINILYVALCGVAVYHGAGRHSDALDPSAASKSVYFTLVAFVPGIISFTVPKFAVLILLTKILDPGINHRRLMWAISVIYALQAAGMIVINFAQCNPPSAQWKGSDGECWPRVNTFAYSLALGICSALFDFYLAIYPTVVLSKLNMGWKKKLGLSSALGFGYCAGAVTVYKCTTLTGLGEGDDFTYDFQSVVLWTSIEANCVLIGACIPTLYPLMKKIFGAAVLGGSRTSSKFGRSTIQTIGSTGKPKRRPRHLSELDPMETGADDNGDVAMVGRQGSGHSGDTTLRHEEGHVPIAQP